MVAGPKISHKTLSKSCLDDAPPAFAFLLSVSYLRLCFHFTVIRGTSLKTIVDTDHLVAIILDDLE